MEALRAGMHVHLVGIGGIGLSAIARVLHGQGFRVSGSDRQESALTRALADEGMSVFIGHRASNVAGADLVVISSAVPDDNPEVLAAESRGVPVVKRDQLLAELTAGKETIAVAGTHGKTTTTAMIAWILVQAGLDPTFVIGGVVRSLGTNARAGAGSLFVVEADEYDRAFLGLRPKVAVVTTLEHDHPDCYPTFADMQAAFVAFVGQVVPGGVLVAGEKSRAILVPQGTMAGPGRVVSYGLEAGQDWHADRIEMGVVMAFDAWHGGRRLGRCALRVPGRHNVLNALAALAAAGEVGVGFEPTAAALATFEGTERRFEIKGEAGGVTVVDDYAHHPTEIRATLAAARARFPGRTLWAVFQPHTYSRTIALLDEFGRAFEDADHVIVTGIYAAREPEAPGVSGASVAGQISGQGHPDARYAPAMDEAAEIVLEEVRPGDVVLTLGAGDGYRVGEWVLAALAALARRGGEGRQA